MVVLIDFQFSDFWANPDLHPCLLSHLFSTITGLPAKKPHFMIKNRQRYIKPVLASSESDGEWVPSKEKAKIKRSSEF